MADNPSNVIPFIMLASVVVAGVSAFFSWRAGGVAGKAAKSTLYLKLQEQYASDEMRRDLRNLRSWRELQGVDFESKWGRLHEQNDPDGLEVDKSRRRASHFFGAIADLYNDRLLSKPMAHRFANYSGADLWFDVVEHLEEELARDYDKSQFDTLRKLRDSSGRQQPKWFKPEITKENVTAGEVEAIHRALGRLQHDISALTMRVKNLEERQKADD